MNAPNSEPIYIFFDGECPSCHLFVRLLSRLSRGQYRFAPLSLLLGSLVKESIELHYTIRWNESVIVWRRGEVLERSEAVMACLAELAWFRVLAYLMALLPIGLLDLLYKGVAAVRYQLIKVLPMRACEVKDRKWVLEDIPDLPVIPRKSRRWELLG